MEERRAIERRPYEQGIQYSVTVLEFRELKKVSLRGDVVDINERGMGIRTDFPLEPGHVVTLNGDMGHQSGIVEWSSVIQDDGYRVGIRFV